MLLAATSAAAVFLANALSYLGVLAVLVRWRPAPAAPRAVAPEHVGAAIRAGGRYVVNSPALGRILLRAGAFIFFASAIWALLPLVARNDLGLGSGGYGLLLGCVGVGAVLGALLLPRLRGRVAADALLGGASVVVAGLALVMAFVDVTAVVAATLAVGGAAWVLALSTLNAAYQTTLPGWVKARGMAFYLVVFQGGTAVGSALVGVLAQATSVRTTLLISGIGLLVGAAAGTRTRFVTIAPEELLPAAEWPTPTTATTAGGRSAVLVEVEYRLAPDADHAAFVADARTLRPSRRRTGATSWRLWQDAADPDRYVEQFVVGSWEEHLRQHDRVTARDAARLASLAERTASPPVATHWIAG